MKKLMILMLACCALLAGCGVGENGNNKTTEQIQQIDNGKILSNYKKLKKINADYLFENAGDYKGKNVMSVAIVGDIDGKNLKLKTDNQKDALFYSFDADCNNEADIEKLRIDEKVCFAGKIGEKFSVGGCVDISNCEIVANGSNVSKYESQLKNGKGKGETKNNKKDEAKKPKKDKKKSYIESCKMYPYGKIKRNPDKYKGKKTKIQGKVVQIDEGWFDTVSMRVQDSSGNDWFVSYSYSDGEDKILENDKISVYGECDGTEQYETILGDTRRMPSIDAEYIK